MKVRLILSVAAFLLLGAAASVAVAWGCAVVGGETATEQATGYAPVEVSGRQVNVAWTVGRASRRGYLSFESTMPATKRGADRGGARPGDLLPAWTGFDAPPRQAAGVYRFGFHRQGLATGWPLVALWCDLGGTGYLGSDDYELPPRGALRVPVDIVADGAEPRVLPYLPVWSGFALDTLLYALALGLVLKGPSALRRLLGARGGANKRPRQDSNLRPSAPEADALSN